MFQKLNPIQNEVYQDQPSTVIGVDATVCLDAAEAV